MWKRDEAVKPESKTSQSEAASDATATPTATPTSQSSVAAGASSIGRSVIIKGELSGTENLTIEGKVEGTVDLGNHVLTVGPQGKVKATVAAKAVVVLGKVVGNITATEKVSIRDAGTVEGDLVAPSVAIADGAHFQGSIDMSGKTRGTAHDSASTVVPSASKANGQAGTATVAH